MYGLHLASERALRWIFLDPHQTSPRKGALAGMYIIPAQHTDEPTARDLMRAAAAADQPGATGIAGVPGAAPGDREWTLVKVCVHEASHAVVAERYGHRTAIRIGRGEEFGTGVCMASGLAHQSEAVRRQVGLAGILGHLYAERGAGLTIARAIEAVRQGPLSESDLRLMNGTATPGEVAICMRRVEHQWGDISTLASELLETELRHYAGRLQ